MSEKITPDDAIRECLALGAQGISLGLAKQLQAERDSLRASNAALKAENEALKKERDDLKLCLSSSDQSKSAVISELRNEQVRSHGLIEEKSRVINNYIDRVALLEAKISLYTSWQPSDPGTKEAMEYVADVEAGRFNTSDTGQVLDHLEVLAHALRAAMVRLEEAEAAQERAEEFALDDRVKADALTARLEEAEKERDDLKIDRDHEHELRVYAEKSPDWSRYRELEMKLEKVRPIVDSILGGVTPTKEEWHFLASLPEATP